MSKNPGIMVNTFPSIRVSTRAFESLSRRKEVKARDENSFFKSTPIYENMHLPVSLNMTMFSMVMFKILATASDVLYALCGVRMTFSK